MTLSDEEKIRRFDASLETYKSLKIHLDKLTTYNKNQDSDDRRQNVAAAGFLVNNLNEIRKCLSLTEDEEALIDQELGITR